MRQKRVRLTVMKQRPHSRNQSTTSSNFPIFQKTGSFRLSRTSTNTNHNEPLFDNQSLRTLDKIPSTKPSITYLDKLWTQIDVLDDVKAMSEQVKEKGSFFDDDFNTHLNKLKQLQEKLLESMAGQLFNNTNNFERQKERYRAATNILERDDENESRKESRFDDLRHGSQQDRFKSTYGDKRKPNKNTLYNKENFNEINRYVNEVKDNLDEVGRSMKHFEDTTRDLWS